MAIEEILMPQMGESVMEGTVIKWLVKPGDVVSEEAAILEIATDKVDTEIPSPFGGKIKTLLCQEGEIVQVGKAIATIETNTKSEIAEVKVESKSESASQIEATIDPKVIATPSPVLTQLVLEKPLEGRFYSPLVLNIAKTEGVSMQELEKIPGNGKEQRVTKEDILNYIKNRSNLDTQSLEKTLGEKQETNSSANGDLEQIKASFEFSIPKATSPTEIKKTTSGNVEIVPMDRTRKIIAQRMLDSKRISAHVTSIVEADVSNIVYWRNRWKTHFKDKENALLTFTPIFVEAVIKAIKDYPKINASVDGENIIYKKDINIGIAVALEDGNLVVPVIKNADQLNIVGLVKQVNDLAKRAKKGQLKPTDLEGGTYTVSNVGSFGNLIGTPILVQPQVGILALGAVVKKPAVIETPYGDTLGIRHKMFLSHSYDHRIIDGSLGGMFVRRVADYLERFDLERKI
jgi:2-oxoglutarate dehydrogenase E2 component (dihydrolipoamide succinyltransferase)